ncbi:MAG: helix-turn-helix domain-containing protein [Treponema sp.]|jgi:AraC-like DNA-binding protein/ligand-binding sensor protein|nr:helix-turn-helix domain-containing protein [Treponema sp.]
MKNNKSKSNMTQDANKDLMEKTVNLMSVYNQATGSDICIYDSACNPVHLPGMPDLCLEKTVCPYCAKFKPGDGNKQEDFPCHEMHMNAIKEANRKGGSHIYQCGMGFVFWTSPIYTNGSFSGAIRGSGFLFEDEENAKKSNENCQIMVDFFQNANDTFVMCNNDISQDELKERVNSYSKADKEKLQSLAEMMLLCAESLSSGSEDYHEILRRRAEQQEVIGGMIEELRRKYPEKDMKPGYPLEKERMFIAALRRGNTIEAKKLLNELLALLIFSNPGHFKYVQLRVTELVVLLSRVEVGSEKAGGHTMEANGQNLKQVQESKTIEELTDILHTIVDRISSIISSFHGIPHAVALRKAESFILENYTRKISLKEIAKVAGLSPPYFSTIFKEEMGENLSKYLNRLRVEKASRLLLETDMTLCEIAGCCCFEDQSWFSKIFKAYTGISPGRYRNQGGGTVQYIGENNLSEAFLRTLKNE